MHEPEDVVRVQELRTGRRRRQRRRQLVLIITLRNRRIFELADYHDLQLDEISLLA